MNFKPELDSANAVMMFYDMEAAKSGKGIYQLYAGTTCRAENKATEWLELESAEQGREHLQRWLQMLEATPSNTNVYTILMIDRVEDGKNPKYFGNSLRMQLNKPVYGSQIQPLHGNSNGAPPMVIAGNSSPDGYERALQVMQAQNERLLQVVEDLQAKLEQQDEDEDEEEDEKPTEKSGRDKIIGAIGSLLERESVQNSIEMAFVGLATKYLSKND